MKRISYMDTMRSLCMLWIIAVWHIGRYMTNGKTFIPYNEYTESVTVGILATFTFLSGYFLGGGKILCRKDVLRFYKKRMKRFYPLFFISCISIFLASLIFHQEGIVSIWQLLFTLTGINCFVGDMPPTIWYFSMLILFYLVTPAVNFCSKVKSKIILSVSVEAFLVVWHICFHSDERVIIYFPVYCVALICAGKINADTKCNFKALIIGLLCSAALIVIYAQFPKLFLLNYFIQVSILVVIAETSKLITNKKTEKIFTTLSYLSMCAYLFHRQFYGALQIVFGNFTWWCTYLVVIPLLLLATFILQTCYDKIILRRDLS